ncbi:MAG: SRPBCC family protein [Acidobacteriota bacterium]|nr:SRPBCC family protein [Acidobacteriota bacterium]
MVKQVETSREIVIRRTVNAPRELVFDVWTNPEHIPHWWGPDGFRTTIFEIDVRPGGEWRYTMHGPDGRDYRNHIVFVEVSRPERLVYRNVPEAGTEPVQFESIVTFDAAGDKTEVTLRMVFPTAKQREFVATQYGAVEGGRQHLGRLAAYTEGLERE